MATSVEGNLRTPFGVDTSFAEVFMATPPVEDTRAPFGVDASFAHDEKKRIKIADEFAREGGASPEVPPRTWSASAVPTKGLLKHRRCETSDASEKEFRSLMGRLEADASKVEPFATALERVECCNALVKVVLGDVHSKEIEDAFIDTITLYTPEIGDDCHYFIEKIQVHEFLRDVDKQLRDARTPQELDTVMSNCTLLFSTACAKRATLKVRSEQKRIYGDHLGGWSVKEHSSTPGSLLLGQPETPLQAPLKLSFRSPPPFFGR